MRVIIIEVFEKGTVEFIEFYNFMPYKQKCARVRTYSALHIKEYGESLRKTFAICEIADLSI